MRVKADDFDCRYVSGRARVAQIVSVCLTYMPLQNQDYLVQELTDWLADRVAQAGLPAEPWFPKSFISLVAKKQASMPPITQEKRDEDIPQQPLKKEFRTVSSSVDMAFVRPQTMQATTTEKIEAPREQSQQIAIRTPRTRGGRRYEYSDKSVGFYTKTRNRYSEAQAILVDAQQQLVHGQGMYLLQAAAPGSLEPSQYELELQRTAHVRDTRLQAPLHARLISAPDIHRRAGQIIDKVHELGKHGIYSTLDEQTLRQKTQRVQQLELDTQVNAAARAYAEGRAIAKSVAAQRSLQRRSGMDGTAHMDDVGGAARPRYLGAKTQQRPEIHDIDQPFPATDHGIDRVSDALLDRDDDFTGLGVGGLNEVMLRAQMLEDEKDADEADGYSYTEQEGSQDDQNEEQEKQDNAEDDDDFGGKGGKNDSRHAGKSGYRFRKTATQLILNQLNVPQYDTPIKPLAKQPPAEGGRAALLSQDQIAKNKLAEYQRDMLEGGKSNLDPRVHQVLRAAAGMFPNDDLFIRSDSDEIEDSEPSDADGQLLDADEAPRMSSRSNALGVLAGQLDAICAVGTQVSDQTRLLQQMSGNKAKVIKQEAAAFEAAEAERIKAIKKKQAMQQSGEKPKEPKRKVFKSEVEKQMAKTISGAPAQVEQLILQERKQIEETKALQAKAALLREHVDDIQSKDKATEEAYQAAAAVEQRKTEAHDALSLAFAQHQRETTTKLSDQIKDVLGTQLFGSKQITDDQKKLLEQIGIEKENFMHGNDHTQMPYVYAKPLLAEALARVEYRTTEVAGADPHGTALVDRTYLPLQPPTRPPNSTRTELLTAGRTGQLQLVARLDEVATLDDVQAAANRVDRQTKPLPKHESRGEMQLPDPRKDPSKVPQGTGRAILTATAQGKSRALPKEDKTVLDHFDRQQEVISQLLPPVRPQIQTKDTGKDAAPEAALEVTPEAGKEGTAEEPKPEGEVDLEEQETAPEPQKPKSKILQDADYLTAIQNLQNGAGYNPDPRVVKKKAKGKGKGKKK